MAQLHQSRLLTQRQRRNRPPNAGRWSLRKSETVRKSRSVVGRQHPEADVLVETLGNGREEATPVQ